MSTDTHIELNGVRDTVTEKSTLSDTQLEVEQLALRDVFRDLTSCYCTVTTAAGAQQSGSIWSNSQFSLKVNRRLGTKSTRKMLFRLAVLYTFLALFQEPVNNRIVTNHRAVFTTIADVLFWTISAIFGAVFCLEFSSIWPRRRVWNSASLAYNTIVNDVTSPVGRSSNWEREEHKFWPTEHLWICSSGIMLAISVIPHAIDSIDGALVGYSKDTIYAFVALVHILRRLKGILMILALTFVFFYYIMQCALAGIKQNDNERSDYFKTNAEGMFSLYVAMTTANHPDMWMDMFHEHEFLMLILVAFMVCTTICLLNIFLAVVSTAYSEMIRETVLIRGKKAEHILANIYESVMLADQSMDEDSSRLAELCQPKLVVSPSTAKDTIRAQRSFQLDRVQGISRKQFYNLTELVAQSEKQQELWFALLDVNQDGHINQEEFLKFQIPLMRIHYPPSELAAQHPPVPVCLEPLLQAIARAPIVLRGKVRKVSAPRFRFLFDFRNGHLNLLDFLEWCTGRPPSQEPHTDSFSHAETGHSVHSDHIERRWSQSSSSTSRVAWAVHLISYKSVLALLNMVVVLIPIMRTEFPSRDTVLAYECDDMWPTHFWVVYMIVFGIDVLLSLFACSTEQEPFYYISPVTYTETGERVLSVAHSHMTHWVDVAFVLLLGMAIANTCSGWGNINYVVILGPVRVVKCAGILHRYKSVKRVWHAASQCIPGIVPQLYLFGLVYYIFMCIGCGVFAGCVTEDAPEGPGDWTGTEWSGAFADETYYYNLNFDNMFSAFVTLFMLMIQNNWHVSGYEQCTGTTTVRWFFVTFNFVTALVMLNLLTGVVLDMYSLYYTKEEERAKDSVVLSMYSLIIERMKRFISKSTEKPFFDSWVLLPKLRTSQMYSGIDPSDAVKLATEHNSHNHYTEDILARVPMPVYARTKGNKIAYCNSLFSQLYGKKVSEMIGLCENFKLGTRIERPVKHWHMAVDSQEKKALYVESGTMIDGTKVIFECSETPIVIPFFGQCTVVYMLPINAKTSSFMLDMNYDGYLDAFDNADLRSSDLRRKQSSSPVGAPSEDATKSRSDSVTMSKAMNKARIAFTTNQLVSDQTCDSLLDALTHLGGLMDFRIALDNRKGVYKLYDLTARSTQDYLQQVSYDQFFESYEILISVAGDEIGILRELVWDCIPTDCKDADLETELERLLGSRLNQMNSRSGLEEDCDLHLVDFLSSVWDRFGDDIPIAVPRFLPRQGIYGTLASKSDQSQVAGVAKADAEPLNETDGVQSNLPINTEELLRAKPENGNNTIDMERRPSDVVTM